MELFAATVVFLSLGVSFYALGMVLGEGIKAIIEKARREDESSM